MKTFKEFQEEWSNKYKKSIDCSNPKGFLNVLIVPREEREQKVKKLNQTQLNEIPKVFT